jgi:bacillithiol synthase
LALQTCNYFYDMFAAEHISYKETNAFRKFVIDYLEGVPELQPFHSFPATLEGIANALQKRTKQPVNRKLLVEVLTDQYSGIEVHERVAANLQSLLDENTFTICTAHQPDLLTGPLYFIYKILHAIKVAEYLSEKFSSFKFVPIYYMGSEDADFDELGHFIVEGKRYEWKTNQEGAFGKLKVDKSLVQLISDLENQLSAGLYAGEFIELVKEYFAPGETIQKATSRLVNTLFEQYGLIVLIADDKRLKQQMIPVFKDDLFLQKPSAVVGKTSAALNNLNYNVQASPREINLFYFIESIRERIVKEGESYRVYNTDICFTAEELKQELYNHPDRFSPNVILRGLFQETILPNIIFLGGGGELAYWSQLKDLFETYNVYYPVLLLRNSFLVVDDKQRKLQDKLGITTNELFRTELEILNAIIEREGRKPQLNGELSAITSIYDQLKTTASAVDPTLLTHVEALKVQAVDRLMILEKKMFRSERKKYEARQRQVRKLKSVLFPGNGLQERVENISSYYSRWGRSFIDELYKDSPCLEQQFTVLYQKN